MQKPTILFLAALLTCLVTPNSLFHQETEAEPQSTGSFGTTATPTMHNWTRFWQIFNAHSAWDLEYNNGSGWISRKSDLQIIKNYSRLIGYPDNRTRIYNVDSSEASAVKISLNFTASYTADYRLTFIIDLDVKNYTHRESSWNYTITYQNYTVYFDWSDLQQVPLDSVNHGVMPVGEETYFWFRIRKNNIQQGINFYVDPSFGNTDEEGTSQFFEDYINAWGFTCPDDGTADSISLYVDATTQAHLVTCAIYDASYNYIDETEEIDVATGAAHWETFAFSDPKPSLTADATYRLAIWGEATAGLVNYYYQTTGGAHRYSSNAYNPPNWEDPLTGTDTAFLASIYCNYTISGEGQTYNVNPDITITFNLGSLATPYYLFQQFSSIVLNFDLASLATSYLVFQQFSSIIVDFDLASLATAYLVFQRFPSIIVNFNLASTAVLAGVGQTYNVFSGIVVDFALASTVQIFRTFIQSHGINLVFALSETASYIQHHFYVNPTIIVDFALSSTSTFIQHFYQVSSSIILNFALSATATFTAAATYATTGFVLAVILLGLFLGGLIVAVVFAVRRVA